MPVQGSGKSRAHISRVRSTLPHMALTMTHSDNFSRAELRGMSGLGGVSPGGERSSTPQPGGSYFDPSLQESDADRSFSQSTLQATAQQKLTHSNDAVIAQR